MPPPAPSSVMSVPFALAWAPWRLSGVVVGAALNDPAELAQLGDAVHAAPYRAPPQGPVLYLKPRHTLCGSGSTFLMPPPWPGVAVRATIGLIIGHTACRLAEADALGAVAGCVLVADLSAPLNTHYRPDVHLRAVDGSCVLGHAVPVAAWGAPEGTVLRVSVRGAPAGDGGFEAQPGQDVPMAGMVRPAARLLAEVTEFMTLHPGDLLLLGTRAGAPVLSAGQGYVIEAPGLGCLHGQVARAGREGAP